MNLNNQYVFDVQINWNEKVDLDLQCVVIDKYGIVCDAVYFKNLKSLNGSVTHSGDSPGTEKITARLSKIPDDIKMLLFFCFLFSPGCNFEKIPSAKISLIVNRCEVAVFPVQVATSGLLFAKLIRRDSQFSLVGIHAPVNAKNFIDCDACIRAEIQEELPGSIAKKPLYNFDMCKGGTLCLGEQSTFMRIGLRWDAGVVAGHAGVVDVDSSCILFDENANVVETVFFGNLTGQLGAVSHSGDNLTGEGEGDDETISIDLEKISLKISQIFIVVNIYTKNQTFRNVKNSQCRVFLGSDQVAFFKIKNIAESANALVVCRVQRGRSGWEVHALGEPANGNMWRYTLPALKTLFYMETSSLKIPEISRETGCCLVM